MSLRLPLGAQEQVEQVELRPVDLTKSSWRRSLERISGIFHRKDEASQAEKRPRGEKAAALLLGGAWQAEHC